MGEIDERDNQKEGRKQLGRERERRRNGERCEGSGFPFLSLSSIEFASIAAASAAADSLLSLFTVRHIEHFLLLLAFHFLLIRCVQHSRPSRLILLPSSTTAVGWFK